ncbi:MAG: leucyl/phenylalanyl-tRNA--protein transferase [Acidobacteria bacterium]|nr:leucyl/phenylalanyl-tRNA--protein transferase [Acidobacteriota bacterium]
MPRLIDFPDPRSAGSEDVVGVGGSLDWRNLVEAYRRGIFPWPAEGWPLPWFCPRKRGVLLFSELRVPRSLAKVRRRAEFRCSIDRAFRDVIEACAELPRRGQGGTWITSEMIEAYTELHRRGFAHSVEAWSGDELVGGLYGVDAGGAFGGESMFFLAPNASKIALLHLIDHLASRGLDWIDIQMVTPHMEALGAKEEPRNVFLERLAETQGRGLMLF